MAIRWTNEPSKPVRFEQWKEIFTIVTLAPQHFFIWDWFDFNWPVCLFFYFLAEWMYSLNNNSVKYTKRRYQKRWERTEKKNQIYVIFHVCNKEWVKRKREKKTLMNFYMWNYTLWRCSFYVLLRFRFVTRFFFSLSPSSSLVSHFVYCDLYVLFFVPWHSILLHRAYLFMLLTGAWLWLLGAIHSTKWIRTKKKSSKESNKIVGAFTPIDQRWLNSKNKCLNET